MSAQKACPRRATLRVMRAARSRARRAANDQFWWAMLNQTPPEALAAWSKLGDALADAARVLTVAATVRWQA